MSELRSPVSRINHVNLRVRDLQTSIGFYRDLLGLEERAVASGVMMSRQCVTRGLDGGGYFGVVLTQGLPSHLEPAGVDHISLEVASKEDVDDLYRRALERRHRVTEPRMYDGHWQIFLFDPDGYKIEIMTTEAVHVAPGIDPCTQQRDLSNLQS